MSYFKKNKNIDRRTFGDKYIQNTPHSPDIAYSIETLWAELKRRVKNRNPKNLEELKILTIDEWNKIPTSFVQKAIPKFY